jgi:NAD(P)-dependent dehydrogenase (short-subunit alcohol dehydrogenase family)
MTDLSTPGEKKLAGRIALVTGASRGIGRAIALELARRGAHVIAMARTQGALEALDDEIRTLGGEATLVPCDVADFPALDRLGAAIFGRWGKLDIFVGNAGVLGPLTPVSHCDPDKWDKLFAVNVTANYRLLRSLDPLLRASDAGRVVLISSGAAQRADYRAFWGPYATSKAAVDAMLRSYAADTVNVSNVKAMSVNPGPMRTKMRASAMPGEDPMTLRTPEEFAPKLADLCGPDWTQTGRIYDFPTDTVLSFQGPA